MGPKVSAAGASGGGGLPTPADAFIREDGVITAPPGTSGGGGGFPVFCAAPMRQTGAATYDAGTFDRYYNNSGGECRQYGRVTVTDSGQQITVAFQGWDAVNQVAQVSQSAVFNVACGYRQMAGVL